MKELRILNEEEKKELVCKIWENPEMQKFVINKYDCYATKDGLILELEKVKKISIDKVIYYDDEYEAPKITEEYFIKYNMRNDPGRSLENYLENKESLEKDGCATGRYDYKGIYLTKGHITNDNVVHFNWFDEKDKYFIRYMTKEEQEDFINLMFERKKQYIERLKKYYKRYSDKIYAYGYWANR